MNRKQLLLIKLAEECSEVAQIIIKTALFGMDDIGPGLVITNRERIHAELNDVMAVVDLLNDEADLEYVKNEKAIENKKDKINFYAEYSKKRGMLNGGS